MVSNPKMPSTVSEQWGSGDIPYSEQEAAIVAEMLQTKPLTQAQATKDQVVRKMSQVCAHVADWSFSPCLIQSLIQWRPNI